MLDQIWDNTVALSTAPIFDDAVYLFEALGLPADQSEDDLDAELALLARESGIHDPYRFVSPPKSISRAISTMTLDSDHRSSRSIHSQETQSTSVTSAPSRTSRDHLHVTDRSPPQRAPPKPARATETVENYGRVAERPTSGTRSRQSSSTLSVVPSAHSSSASSKHAPARRRRGSALFSMFRKDSRYASRLWRDSRGTRLGCGHSLSTYAIREHIQEALQRGGQAVPSCCGKALPRSVLESVTTKEETELVLEGHRSQFDVSTMRDSGYMSSPTSPIGSPRSFRSTPSPGRLSTLPSIPSRRTRHEPISIDSALANEAFKSFKTPQKEQFERISTFECNQRKALSAHHQSSMKWLVAQHETNRDKRKEQHIDDAEQLEERQLMAEDDLLKAQALETQNVATALKWIEAYCLGTNADQLEHARTLTEKDFKKLDQQRMTQQYLPRRHENAINVLRARQEIQTKRKLEKQEADLEQLDAEHEKEKVAKQAEYLKELDRLEAVIEARRKRLLQRWDLKLEMWRRDWEEQHSTTLNAKLEHEDWPPRKADHAITISYSSSLASYVKATA
ncbi:hypothetical protein EJ02DRAFT_478066 [Clathrospora elynae]|uniref:Uncharacterized protein n=1 Tax=Clathrospora elynae TaxID=706981 RepID=A0A6A5SZI3_9PLEO|nr:hypothetical protein EJ02DRAFT_478066 [Clathrospora elynae]